MKAVQTAATYAPVLDCAARLLSELDVLVAFAHVAATCPTGNYVRPTFVDVGSEGALSISIKGARHPVVEAQASPC